MQRGCNADTIHCRVAPISCLVAVNLNPLGDEGSKPLCLLFGEVEMIPRVALLTADADRDPAVPSGEAHIALGERALGMGSGKFRHDYLTQLTVRLLHVPSKIIDRC